MLLLFSYRIFMISISELYENGNFHTSLQNFKVPDDYKFHCFGDEIFSETIIDRGIDTRCTFFDKNWKSIPVNITYDFAQRDIPKPPLFNTMFTIGASFYEDIGYLRCDFYVLDQQLYIGELTMTPGGGCLPIRPYKYDEILGKGFVIHKFPKNLSYCVG